MYKCFSKSLSNDIKEYDTYIIIFCPFGIDFVFPKIERLI